MASDDSTPLRKTCTKCGQAKAEREFRLAGKRYKPGKLRAQCRQCDRESRAIWGKENQAYVAQKGKEHRKTNPEKRSAYNKAWNVTHKKERSAYNKAWRAAHAEERRLAYKLWDESNKEHRFQYKKSYRAQNRVKQATLQGKRRARQRNLPDTFTHEQEQFCRQYFHYACAACGNEEGFQWTIALDHWIPLKSSECTGTVAANMIPLCHGMGGCNNSKKHSPPEQWILQRFGKRKAAHILKRIEAYFSVVRLSVQPL